ncbi:DUF6621 family protein [Bacteroides ihuae]|uniref:DUF6621 family protein n=1 Tax=Bacteroides ihuae TaxID=1852362 RepID=UPI0008DAFE54|nr:DUF6621 family protein [Bacteroides ihuae]
MEEKIKLAETVMLIDAAYMNFVIADLKKNFERMLGRSLQEIDLSHLITYLALDASMSEGENQIQVLWVYDDRSSKLLHCHPSDLKEELNGVAFSNPLGEFSFASVPSAEMVSREDLYFDLFDIVADSTDVKKMIIVSFNEEYGDRLHLAMNKVTEKEIILFCMDEPKKEPHYQWEVLAYPLMQSLGIKGDELS